MKHCLYRACMAQLQMMLAVRETSPELPPIGPDAPNYALMMRVKR